MGLAEKWKQDALRFERVTNNHLLCADCIKRFDDKAQPGNVSKCFKYEDKSNKVLLGGLCDLYDKEKSQ